MKAVLVSSSNSGSLFYYWRLHYEENEASFKEVKYPKFYTDTTLDEQIEGFWKLLEEDAFNKKYYIDTLSEKIWINPQ